MIVCKFGGTSVANSNAIQHVYSILSSKKETTFIVVSAFSKVTDYLLQIVEYLNKKELYKVDSIINGLLERHQKTAIELGLPIETQKLIDEQTANLRHFVNALKILGEITPRSIDVILSFGEILSSIIIYEYLKLKGFSISYVDPREILITDSNFTCAEVDFDATKKRIIDFITKNKKFSYYITGGFVGSTIDGYTTTLGRGGSDYSASVIASLVGAKELEIWTDVDGIMTTDPNLVPSAKLIKEISYVEASEMAIFGAKVLHPKTIFPAVEKKIPVFVKNTFNTSSPGTLITYRSSSKKEVKAITFRKNVVVINIVSNRMLGTYGYLARVFDVFKRYETEIDLVSTSEVSISLTIENKKNLSKIVKELKEISDVDVIDHNVIISVIGEGLKYSSTVPYRIFKVLEGIKIQMVSMGASDINLSIVVKEKHLKQSVENLHNEFFGK